MSQRELFEDCGRTICLDLQRVSDSSTDHTIDPARRDASPIVPGARLNVLAPHNLFHSAGPSGSFISYGANCDAESASATESSAAIQDRANEALHRFV